jgi:hypothetical protein
MERSRIEARGDSEMAPVAQNQFERSRWLEGLIVHGGLPRSGTDMDRQEGGRLSRGGDVSRWVGAAS